MTPLLVELVCREAGKHLWIPGRGIKSSNKAFNEIFDCPPSAIDLEIILPVFREHRIHVRMVRLISLFVVNANSILHWTIIPHSYHQGCQPCTTSWPGMPSLHLGMNGYWVQLSSTQNKEVFHNFSSAESTFSTKVIRYTQQSHPQKQNFGCSSMQSTTRRSGHKTKYLRLWYLNKHKQN